MRKVAVIMGSTSDLPVAEKAIQTLKEYGIETEVRVLPFFTFCVRKVLNRIYSRTPVLFPNFSYAANFLTHSPYSDNPKEAAISSELPTLSFPYIPSFQNFVLSLLYSKHNENFLHRQRIWDIMLYLG